MTASQSDSVIFPGDAGVVDQHVDAAVSDRRLDRSEAVGAGDVGGDVLHAFGKGGGEVCLLDGLEVTQQQRGALVVEPLGGDSADAARCTGDEDPLA